MIDIPHLDGMFTARCIREQDPDVLIIFITNLAQYERQQYIANGGDSTYIVEANSSLNIWLTILVSVDAAVAVIEIAYWMHRARENKAYKAQQESAE